MTRMSPSTPFIIWTLQRTGGTTLARRLFERSGLLEAARARVANGEPGGAWLADVESYWKLHEPFNYGIQARIYGRVTDHWMTTYDRAVLEGAIDQICALRLPIKHCVEMVPVEISEALGAAASAHGYGHLFLYRRNPVNRLLSLHFARMSGIWGPEMKGGKEISERIFAQPLPVEKMIAHEKKCTQRLTDQWNFIRARGADPMALAFEDVYQNDQRDQVVQHIVTLLRSLNMSRDEQEDLAFVEDVLGTGDQGTRDKYDSFPGINRLEAALKTIPVFCPGTFSSSPAGLDVFSQNVGNPLVLHAAVDWKPASIEKGQRFDIGGVVVLKESLPPESMLLLVDGEVDRKVIWSIDSPMIAKQFPNSPNGAKARFKAIGLQGQSGRVYQLCLDLGNGRREEVIRFRIDGAA